MFHNSSLSGHTWVQYTTSSEGVNEYFANDCVIIESNTKIECLTSEGYGSEIQWKVSIGGLTSNTIKKGTYKRPSLNKVTLNNQTVGVISTTGVFSNNNADYNGLIFEGNEFGTDSNLISVVYESNSFEYRANQCNIIEPRVKIQCESIQPGVGTGFRWKVLLDLRSSEWLSTPNIKYASPSITSVSGEGAIDAYTNGGQTVLIQGDNFGPAYHTTPIMKYGLSASEYTAQECVVINHENIECKTAEGTGKNHSWTVEISGQMSNVFAAGTNYRAPSISYYSGIGSDNASTEGNDTVIIYGTNFGPKNGADIYAKYGLKDDDLNNWLNATDCLVVESNNVIECRTSEGAGTDLIFSLLIDDQYSIDDSTSYAPPLIDSVSLQSNKNTLLTSGGETVIIKGRNFGPSFEADQVSVSYGINGFGYTPSCDHISHYQLNCITAPGSGFDFSWVVKAKNLQSDPSINLISYTIPEITDYPSSNPTIGDSLITIKGTNFAVDDDSSTTFVYFNDVISYPSPNNIRSGKESASGFDELDVLVPPGEGLLEIYVGIINKFNQEIKSTAVVSVPYEPPEIETIYTDVVEIDGYEYVNLELRGDNFGLNPIPFITFEPISNESDTSEFSDFSNYIISKNHKAITIRFKYSLMTNLEANIFIQVAQFSSDTKLFEAKSPQINLNSDLFTGGNGEFAEIKQEYNTAGGEILQIPVIDIGNNIELIEVKISDMSCTDLEIIVDSNDSDYATLECTIPPGQGRNHQVIVHRAAAQSEPVILNYHPPSIDSINTFSSSKLNITTIGEKVKIYGSNFGQFNTSKVFMIKRDNTIIDLTSTINELTYTHEFMEISIPEGQGSGFKLSIIVLDQASNEFKFSYASPVIDSITPNSLPTEGGLIKIMGENFGIEPEVFIGENKCSIINSNHTFIECNVQESQGSNLKVIVVSDDLNSQALTSVESSIFSFEPPEIISITPSTGHTHGEEIITVTGKNFGVFNPLKNDYSFILNSELDLVINELPYSSIVNVTHENIQFILPEGQGEFIFNVNVAGQNTNNDHIIFTYNAPYIDAITPSHGSTSGEFEIELSGLSFGKNITSNNHVLFTVSVTIGAKECEVISQNHFEIICLAPSGVGVDHDVMITTIDNKTSNIVSFSYDPPNVQCSGCGFQPNLMDANGGQIVICGENFGVESPKENEPPIEVVIGDIICLEPKIVFDLFTCGGKHHISCVTQPSYVGPKNVSISIGGQTSFWNESLAIFNTRCRYQSYGEFGEICLECDDPDVFGAEDAATCEDKFNSLWGDEPVANPGWWEEKTRTESEKKDLCHEERLHRDQCVYFLPCEPKSSCLGDNECEIGYQYLQLDCETKREILNTTLMSCSTDSDCNGGDESYCNTDTPQYCSICSNDGVCECTPSSRCALCTSGRYFREGGKCVECPNNTWIVIILVIIGVLGIMFAGFVANNENLNLAFISIGVDYFQILAMFRRSNVDWPPELVTIFRYLSIFNFNLDIAAPECIVPNFEFETKWYLTQLLPWGPGVLFSIIVIIKLFWKRCVKGITDTDKLYRHTNSIFSIGILIFY